MRVALDTLVATFPLEYSHYPAGYGPADRLRAIETGWIEDAEGSVVTELRLALDDVASATSARSTGR